VNEEAMARVGRSATRKKRNEIMWKNILRAGQATDENMAHAHCMLHT